MSDKHAEFADLLREDRVFPPSDRIPRHAVVRDEGVYADADRDPEAFWARFAGELEWSRPWTAGARLAAAAREVVRRRQLNASVNCVDRHARGARRNKAAIIWEGEPGDRRTLTYFDLQREVSQVRERPEVARRRRRAIASRIYMPLVPELAIAMLACARIGAVAQRRVRRVQRRVAARSHQRRPGAACSITADGGFRRGQIVPLKQVADEARRRARPPSNTSSCSSAAAAVPIPVTMTGGTRPLVSRADGQGVAHGATPSRWTPRTCSTSSIRPARPAKPKGIMHTTGGYLVGTYATTKMVSSI